MRLKSATIAVITAMFGSGALAANITNLDQETHTLTVIVGEEQLEYAISPADTLDLGEVCEEGCSVVLPNGEEYELAAGDTAYIQNGTLGLEPGEQGSDDSDVMPLESDQTEQL